MPASRTVSGILDQGSSRTFPPTSRARQDAGFDPQTSPTVTRRTIRRRADGDEQPNTDDHAITPEGDTRPARGGDPKRYGDKTLVGSDRQPVACASPPNPAHKRGLVCGVNAV